MPGILRITLVDLTDKLCQNIAPGFGFMSKYNFCITTLDQLVLSRWQNAFKNQGWEAQAFNSLDAPAMDTGCAELDLVEVCSTLCQTPEDLQKIIKKRKPVAILAFSAPQNISDSQIVKFLEAGADDFVFSNMDERIIVAKLKAYIRRLTPAIAATMSRLESAGGNIKIDRDRRTVKIEFKPGKYTELSSLTQRELEILSMLVRNETRVVSRESMLDKLWGDEATEVYSDCINKHIETLRRKLGRYGSRIKTVYGSGYMFTGDNKS